MRAGPLGVLFAEDEAGLVATAVEQSLVTHRDARCAAGAVAVAGAVALGARPGPIQTAEFVTGVASLAAPVDESVSDAIRRLTEWAHLPPSEACRRMQQAGLDPASSDEWRGVSSLVTPSVVWSLYAFLQAPDDYWAAVCTAIEAGGDTDTMAAMTGAIAGARSGPESLPRTLLGRITDRGEWGTGRLAELADRTMRLVAG
jgi:ADP-ribosylglycohydrolase